MTHTEGEVIRVLNNGEPEAIPLQRVGRGQYVALAIPPASSRRAWSGRTRISAGSGMVCRTMCSVSVYSNQL